MVAIGGLGSGIDTQSLIAQLVAFEQQKIATVEMRSTARDTALSSWTSIRSALSAITSAASSIVKPSGWLSLTAASSDENAATVSAGSGTMSGSLSFTVAALAQAGIVRSVNTIPSLSTKITTDAALFVASGGAKLGFAGLASNDAVTLGTHTIAVTQSSSGAQKAGTAPLATSTVIDGTNNALQIELNGATYNLTLASGTYDAQQLADAVQSAATAAGAGAKFTLGATNALNIASSAEGSVATMRVTGGSALAALNLTTDVALLTGTDGKLTVDGGATQTFGNTTAITAGSTIQLAAAAGTITATISGGFRLGSITGNNVASGDGSLQAVVSAINGAQAGMTAAAVLVGPNAYRLQLGSNTTGLGADPTLGGGELDASVVGGLTVLAQGADATITMGTGPGSYSVTSTTNTISNLLPGVSVTLKKVTTDPVTITVDRNAAGLADSVQKLVEAANAAVVAVSKATAYDVSKRVAAPLTGDLGAERVRRAIYNSMSNAVAGATPGSPGLAGVTTDSKGNYSFDRQKFLDAYAKDPDGVAKVFNQWGSSTSGSISLVNATSKTLAGTYAVNITQAATQASATSAGTPGAGITVRARIGVVEGAYTVQGGDTAATIAAGLNASFASQNLSLVASANGANVDIKTAGYGSGSAMTVAWDGSTFNPYAGVDVAGTINGVASTGIGQSLGAPSTDPTLAGLTIQVVGSQTGAIGSITYTQGVAARLTQAIAFATDSLTGYITTSEAGIKANKKLIDDQVDRMNLRLVSYQANLKRQYSQLDTLMGQLKNQSNWLTGQIASLNAGSG